MSKIVEKSTNRKTPPDMKKEPLFRRTAACFLLCLFGSFTDHLRLISTTSLQALSPAESVMTQR